MEKPDRSTASTPDVVQRWMQSITAQNALLAGKWDVQSSTDCEDLESGITHPAKDVSHLAHSAAARTSGTGVATR